MKKAALLLFAGFALLSCTTNVKDHLTDLNGYWEIEKVVMPDGSEKDYSVNTTIDYFEVKGTTGFRKKVMPQFDGTYRVNDLSEKVNIVQKNDSTYIDYSTPYAKWEENLMELTDDKLVLKNNHDIIYHYKKPIPFTVK